MLPRLDGQNSRHLFLTVLEAVKAKMIALADAVSVESPPLGSQTLSSHCVFKWQRDKWVLVSFSS